MSAERKLLLPEEVQLNLALELYNHKLFGIKEEPFSLKSGRMSPHYLNVRPGISSFNFRGILTSAMAHLTTLRSMETNSSVPMDTYDHIAGTPEAMTSYAASIADLLGMSLLQPRVATKKTSGNQEPILGEYSPGQTVVEYDDVVTDGQAKIDTIDAFTAIGLDIADYFVVLDREEGGGPHIAEVTGIQITPALGVSSMARMLRAEREMSAAQYDQIAKYLDRYGEPHAQEAMNSSL